MWLGKGGYAWILEQEDMEPAKGLVYCQKYNSYKNMKANLNFD